LPPPPPPLGAIRRPLEEGFSPSLALPCFKARQGEKHLNGFEPITSAPKADTLPVKLKMIKVKLNYEIFTLLLFPTLCLAQAIALGKVKQPEKKRGSWRCPP
jgi:hypothetical protein